MYLVSLYFDERSSQILQRYINQIAEKTGNTFMTENCVPPHMTIAAIEARNIEVLVPSLKKLRDNLQAGKIQFVSVGQFLPYVFYATPVLNEYLNHLSTLVYETFKDIPETLYSRYYKPLSWLPHVTLGKTLSKEQMQIAFYVMQDNFSPFEAAVTEIGLAKVNPHEDVMRFEL